MIKKRTSSADFAFLRHQAEEHLSVTQQNNPAFSSSPADVQRILHELAVYQIELEMQQDELLQARAELEESLDCYTELYDFAPLGYLTLDREGTIRKANLAGSKLLGVNRSRLKGDRLGRFISVESLAGFNAMLERAFSTREHGACEAMLQRDGVSSSSEDPFLSSNISVLHSHTVRIDAVVSNDGQECHVVLSDISMQKQIERENKALLDRLIQARRAESIGASSDSALRNFNHQLLDKVIHARIRFAALSYLFAVEQASFVEIKKQIRTTDGNLSVHLRMLESAEYISCDKDVRESKPQSIYRITEKGHDALLRYKACLSAFLGI
ncbi:MAG: histidine kinase [Chlorobium sp.]|nr:MAG: histidine kinase [Chlorobium sp.]